MALRLVVASLALGVAAGRANAQQSESQQVGAADPSLDRTSLGQQPGQGADVRTGTSSGLDAEAHMRNLLADHQYARAETELGQLPPERAQLYRGVLANRSNDLKNSIELLNPLLNQVTASGDVAEEKLLRETLSEDYLREGDWARAARAYEALDERLGAKMTADEKDSIELPLKLLPLAKDNPPMTVEPCDPFTMQVNEDPLGLIDIPVFVDANPKSWMFDPTAPFNLLSRSTAKEVGLKVSDETATIHTLTGKPIQVHMAMVPRFTIGGQLTLRDMTVFVYDDADYYFPYTRYQVEGVLGYPALSALGSVTVTDNGTIRVRPSKEIDAAETADLLTTGTRFYLDGDQIIVGVGRDAAAQAMQPAELNSGASASDSADDRMYSINAGGQQTWLTSRYFDEHTSDFSSQKMDLYHPAGYDSTPAQPAYVAETVPLTIGGTPIKLHFIRVLTQPVSAGALDDVYGVLGIDALDQLQSYTFDYRTMRFSVKQE